jgi:hypothetical protein
MNKILSALGKFKNTPLVWAQGLHALLAFTVMTQVPAPWGHPWILAAAILAGALVVEGWFDAEYEPDPFWPGGAMDLAFYTVGAGAGLIRLAL